MTVTVTANRQLQDGSRSIMPGETFEVAEHEAKALREAKMVDGEEGDKPADAPNPQPNPGPAVDPSVLPPGATPEEKPADAPAEELKPEEHEDEASAPKRRARA